MSSKPGVGILSVAAYLPDHVRTNDYWPGEIVAEWRAKNERFWPQARDQQGAMTPDAARVFAAMEALRDDPFQGAQRRHIMPDTMLSSDMETFAARAAIAKAGLVPAQIDALLSHTMVPDYLTMNHASIIQDKVGLRQDILALPVDAVCCSFLMQLHLAQQMVAGGTARHVLLTQSSAVTRLMRKEEPHSAWFGDAATAVVVGAVPGDRGLRETVFGTDGSLHRGLLCGVPGKHWYDDGRVVAYSPEPRLAHRVILNVGETARTAMGSLLAKAGERAERVDFYASHQASPWFRTVTQACAGFDRARSLDIFAWAGSVGSANIPMQLYVGEREGTLRDGDLVAAFTFASGLSWAGALLRWGAGR